MNRTIIWEKLTSFIPLEEPIFSYEDMEKWIYDNPTEMLVYLNGIFQALSIERMRQLATTNNRRSISERYFDMHSIKHGWKKMKTDLNAPMNEFKLALSYVNLIETCTKRNLKVNETKEGWDLLLRLGLIHFGTDQESTQSKPEPQNHTRPVATASEISTVTTKSIPPSSTASELPKDTVTSDNQTQPNTMTVDLLESLRMLQASSKESVVNANTFGEFRNYMHIRRPIEESLIQSLESIQSSPTPQLILLAGSVGDGKSHLLAFIKEKYPHLLNNVVIHNDASESFNPSKNSISTLDSVLKHFDEGVTGEKHVLLAINLGILNNFYNFALKHNRYQSFRQFVDASDVFGKGEKSVFHSEKFQMINIAGYQTYSISENGASSPFFQQILEKITRPSENNPFYVAYQNDLNNGIKTVVHENFECLSNPIVQKSIIDVIVQSMLTQKLLVSTRSFYNLVFDILVPVNVDVHQKITSPHDALPNLLFGHPDRSPLMEALHKQDPLAKRTEQHDSITSEFFLADDPRETLLHYLDDLASTYSFIEQTSDTSADGIVEFLLRSYTLMNLCESDDDYLEFTKYVHAFYSGNGDEIEPLFELIKNTVYRWKGIPYGSYIFSDSEHDAYRIAYPFSPEETVDYSIFASAEVYGEDNTFERFQPFIRIGFTLNQQDIFLSLDFKLYVLLKKIGAGYRPNRQDLRAAVQFNDFYDTLLRYTDKDKSMIIISTHDNSIMELTKPKFSKAKYEVRKVR